jgi:ubiquinone/menaquinone biosynthesis C-methylase UbiE
MIDMSNLIDQQYLKTVQYKNASQLNARIQLHAQFSTNRYGWFKWVFDQFELPPDANILEIGCGPGTLWLENKDRISNQWSIILSDFSPGMVCEAKASLSDINTPIFYDISDGMSIPFPQETFTTVIANHVLPHIPDRQRALVEIKRVLKSNGRFYASTIGKNHMRELSQIIDTCTRLAGSDYSIIFNVGGFTLENGMQQLVPFFHQINVRYYDDALVVTETKPLLAYILSMIPQVGKVADIMFINNLSATFDQLIDIHGSICIQKSSGIFIGEKGYMDAE